MMSQRHILCVDDEPLVLEGLERTLRQSFEVMTETKPLAALALLEKREYDFVAVISDMRMPLMDGAKFLSCAAEIVPNSTRVLLTGHAELNAAIAAVNTGRIFRFLCKPCAPNDLLSAVEAAAEQHQLRTLEKQLLEQTLTGSVRLLTEVLTLVAPKIFTRSQLLQAYMLHLARALGRNDAWRFELAACLSMIGCVGLPDDTLNRALAGTPLDEQEARSFAEHPLSTHRLLKKIPHVEDVAEMIRLQVDGASTEDVSADVLLGANMLRVARDVEALVAAGATEAEAVKKLQPGCPPARLELLKLLGAFASAAPPGEVKELGVAQLTANMSLEDDVKTKSGAVLIPANKQLTLLLLERLLRFSRAGLLVEPVRVRVPN
ncbi:MAG TPA: HD domain-containing phosphohydrolase [Polyangiaceae bacterium]|nr:HD domain-containing phosphohydrolase [Polyangiaceae bacterium]